MEIPAENDDADDDIMIWNGLAMRTFKQTS